MNARLAPLMSWLALLSLASVASAQAVCLPAPRLLTTVPMGGQAGTSVEVTVTGQHIEEPGELIFSHPGITAEAKRDEKGQVVPLQYVVTIADDCPVGVHGARILSRLGVSSSRAFSVGRLQETKPAQANRSLEAAMLLPMNSVCNSSMTQQAVDFYAFEAAKDQRVFIDCAAQGIDSKHNPVVIVADEKGADLLVERRGGAIDFTAPESGRFVIKVHDLTYKGGPHHFYRLAVREAAADEPLTRMPSTRDVSAFSWPPAGLEGPAPLSEQEPNDKHSEAQKITLPCDLSGSFFPAADVDTFEFSGKKGDVWWVEVASQRLGRPTDASIVVQQVRVQDGKEERVDLVELSDIPSPVKVSSNGYSYDGPPYNAGSTDILGKLEIKEDGLHRLQIRDLFGGTRRDPRNVYRLIIRKAAPDFALVGWALHMNLRNGDRNALSKPLALRGGATMPLEVVVVRRDGFDGKIDLFMENLPDGVTATGLSIPAGKSRGTVLVTAAEGAPRGFQRASFFGRAKTGEQTVTRPCHYASMQWPVPDAWGEIPSPRLVADIAVSVCGSEWAPLTIEPAEKKVWEVTAGEKLTIPLVHTRRCDFSGANISLRTYGAPFEGMPAFDAALTADQSSASIDLAALKTPPGEYVIAFYGSAVAKFKSPSVPQPKDIVDIFVSTPITIRVRPAEPK